jgi:hypothetical protein
MGIMAFTYTTFFAAQQAQLRRKDGGDAHGDGGTGAPAPEKDPAVISIKSLSLQVATGDCASMVKVCLKAVRCY